MKKWDKFWWTEVVEFFDVIENKQINFCYFIYLLEFIETNNSNFDFINNTP